MHRGRYLRQRPGAWIAARNAATTASSRGRAESTAGAATAANAPDSASSTTNTNIAARAVRPEAAASAAELIPTPPAPRPAARPSSAARSATACRPDDIRDRVACAGSMPPAPGPPRRRARGRSSPARAWTGGVRRSGPGSSGTWLGVMGRALDSTNGAAAAPCASGQGRKAVPMRPASVTAAHGAACDGGDAIDHGGDRIGHQRQ